VSEIRPLILLLENDPGAREAAREVFDSVGCSVLAVPNHESAFKELMSVSEIDFILTDLNLREDLPGDKSGLMFAKMAKQLRRDIPIAAYSAKTAELGLTPDDYREFALYFDKGKSPPGEFNTFALKCKGLAIAHRSLADKIKLYGDNALLTGHPRQVGKDEDTMVEIQRLREEIHVVRQNAVTKEHLKKVAQISWIVFGLVAGAASILGFLVAR
jgi:CheY-like chemotaxis protein